MCACIRFISCVLHCEHRVWCEVRRQEAGADRWRVALHCLAAGSCLVTSAQHRFRCPRTQLPSDTSAEGEGGHGRRTSPCAWPFPVDIRVLQWLYNAVSREAWAADCVQEVSWSEKFWIMSHCWAALSPSSWTDLLSTQKAVQATFILLICVIGC